MGSSPLLPLSMGWVQGLSSDEQNLAGATQVTGPLLSLGPKPAAAVSTPGSPELEKSPERGTAGSSSPCRRSNQGETQSQKHPQPHPQGPVLRPSE